MSGYLNETNGNGQRQLNGTEKGSSPLINSRPPVTVPLLQQMKAQRIPIAALTAYDYSLASQMDKAGVDLVLVGDSLGSVVQGQPNTLSVSLENMLYHTKLVSRALRRPLLVADLPFSSMYSVNVAVSASVRLVAEGAAAMVKLELGSGQPMVLDMIRALSQLSIPVCAHLGLTPQSVHALGGYRVQGGQKSARSADQILEQARAVEQAGASLLVLECVPAQLAQQVTQLVGIPTIGIGASSSCDGQILVVYDMLGISAVEKAPKFVKNFLRGRDSVFDALSAYVQEVKAREYPAEEHTYH